MHTVAKAGADTRRRRVDISRGRFLASAAGAVAALTWAAEIGCTGWAQVLLKFVLGHPAVTCVIPGTSKPEHMRDNAQAGFGAMPNAQLRVRMVADSGF
jgi:aryl-alcohol dehydrogenase-like predicted oxidoreductase